MWWLVLLFIAIVIGAIAFYIYYGVNKKLIGGLYYGMGPSGVEYEARFLNVDKEKIRKKLKELGAKKEHKVMKFKRTVHRVPETVKGYARVRDEGDKITMTVKSYKPESKHAIETEVSINEPFEIGTQFLENSGLPQKAYQETYREKWIIDGCNEITIDDIPALSYVEIDCKSEEKVFNIAEKLGLDKSQAHYGPFSKTYEEEYGIPKHVIDEVVSELVFTSAEEILLPHVVKNKDKFMEVLERQINEFS